ncbi:hypothetical protein [Micromonospora sp. NPDC093277]|uniref:hypothetical protein n=1 Tax=Micromonospora sp. NPDC093277 TaxID=3364291 RepID=UPI003817F100
MAVPASVLVAVGPAQAAAPTRAGVVSAARAEVGSSEANGGRLEYGPGRTYEWCAMFADVHGSPGTGGHVSIRR